MDDVLTDQRDHVIDRLTSEYANGSFEVEELERRLALVHAARTPAELDVLAPARVTSLVPAQHLRVVFGSIERAGPWAVPAQLVARVLWGNLVLDLREARLAPGPTTIDVRVAMGNVEVIVPPGVDVEVDATSFLGNIEQRTEGTRVTGARTSVRVVGTVKLGNLEVSTRRAGETQREARRRRRAELAFWRMR
jgi:hypothetical protein